MGETAAQPQWKKLCVTKVWQRFISRFVFKIMKNKDCRRGTYFS